MGRNTWIMCAAALLGGVMPGAAWAQSGARAVDRAEVLVQRASSAIELDGALNERAWADASAIPLAWEIDPADNAPAALATDCRLTFDDEHLYFGCVAHDDDPDRIRAFLTDRDDTAGQDAIGLMLDPFRDQRRAFAFSVTPLGVQGDFVFDQGESNDAWNAIWDAEGRRTSDGYVVEAAIPLASLRFPAGAGIQSWNFFFWRSWPRSTQKSFRSVSLDRSNQCALCQLGTATGFRAATAGANLELTPVVTGQRVDVRSDIGAQSLTRGEVDDQYGLDARWSLTPDLTLNATLNPDFSQVEADAQQVRSNQQFALFFREQRPFFVEGAEFYQTPVRAVFTRSIADPSFGTKVTGKIGQWAIGALVARDETTNLLFPAAQSSGSGQIDQGATTVLGRIRRDVGGSHTVGGLVTSRTGAEYVNHVVGADARVQLLGPLNLSGQVLRSWTEYPAAVSAEHAQPTGRFRGTGAMARLDFATRNWFGWVILERMAPGFRADAGFVPAVDARGVNWRVQRRWWTDDTPGLTRVAVLGGSGLRDDAAGEPSHRFVFADLNIQGALQTEAVLNPDHFWRYYEGRRFEISRLNTFGSFQPTSRIEAGWFAQFGEELDFTNARESGLLHLAPWIDFRIGSHVNLELDYKYKRLAHGGRTVFREQIGEVLALYYLSRRAFFRAQLQVRDLVRYPEQYRVTVDRGGTSVATQLLFSYKLNPMSVLFLGYADQSLNERENRDPALGLVRMGRSIFVKLSYAWRP